MKNTNNTSLVDGAPAGYCWRVTEAAKEAVIERLKLILRPNIWAEGYFEAADAERFMRNDLGARGDFEIAANEHALRRVDTFGYTADEVVLRLIHHPVNINDSLYSGELAAEILRGVLPDFGGVRAELVASFEASGLANFLKFSEKQSDALAPLLNKYAALYKEAWEAERATKVV